MEDGRVGERSSGMLVRLSAGGSVGESSEGTRVLFALACMFVPDEVGDLALTGDFVRALFSGLGGLILEEASATSLIVRFLSCCFLGGELAFTLPFLTSPRDIPLTCKSLSRDCCLSACAIPPGLCGSSPPLPLLL